MSEIEEPVYPSKQRVHGYEFTDYISGLIFSSRFSDVIIHCKNNQRVKCHRVILAGVSPFLKEILNTQEDIVEIILPDIPIEDVKGLLSLLYTGKANIYEKDTDGIIDLSNVLQIEKEYFLLIQIEAEWTEKFPKPARRKRKSSKISDEIENSENVPSVVVVVEPKRRNVLSTHKTRSGRTVAHSKKFAKEDDEEDSMEIDPFYDSKSSYHPPPVESKLNFNSANSFHEFQIVTSSTAKQLQEETNMTFSIPTTSDTTNVVQESPTNVFITNKESHEIMNPMVENSDTKELIHTCALCQKQLLGRHALGKHMKNSHPIGCGPYACPKVGCEKKLKSGSDVLKHAKEHEDQRSKIIAGDSKKFSCYVENCQVEYTTQTRLKEHIRRKHHEMSKQPEILQNSQSTSFLCNAYIDNPRITCHEEFSTAKHFIYHMKKCHEVKPWICTLCPDLKRFEVKQNFQFHELTHSSGTRNFVCDICQKSYQNSRQLYNHRALHLGRRFNCNQCGFAAKSSANLRGHIKTKHEERRYECDVCLKKFSSSSNLKSHQRVHTGETPFQCELCDIKFKRIHHLNAHIDCRMHREVIFTKQSQGITIPENLDPNILRRKNKMENTTTTIKNNQHPGSISVISNSREGETFETTTDMVVIDQESYVMLDGQTVEIIQDKQNPNKINVIVAATPSAHNE